MTDTRKEKGASSSYLPRSHEESCGPHQEPAFALKKRGKKGQEGIVRQGGGEKRRKTSLARAPEERA